MTGGATTISLRIDAARDQVAGLLDLPAPGAPARTPVLICAPWGWDEVASYRVRREWAQQLAGTGSPTLRFDLPAVGDSTGVPAEEGIVARWVEAVAAAATRLDAEAGGGGVAVLGLGLGGLLGLRAAPAAPAIAAAALWAMPASGKRFVREQRAFSRMEPWQAGEEGDFDPGIAAGWIEAGGFGLAPATLAELAELEPDLAAPGGLRRVLGLERDGVAFDAKLATAIEAAGIAFESAPGPGWGAMVSHPERAELPGAVAATFSAWLGASAAPRSGARPIGDGATARLRLRVDGRQVAEEPFPVVRGWGRAYGVLASPVEEPGQGPCCVFLNAGAVRHVGPDRLWVEAARRWAAHGVTSLRVDLEGIGESDGTAAGRKRVEDFYTPAFDDDVTAVLDALQVAGRGERFLLVGLCSGGYWAFRAAADPRVEAAVLLNAGALHWAEGILDRRQSQKLARAIEPGWWLQLLRGEVGLARVRYFSRLALARARHRLRRAISRRPVPSGRDDLAIDLDRTAGTRIALAFSGGEPLASELRHEGIVSQLERWPNVQLLDLPGADHTLRSPAAQAAAHRLLDSELDKLTAPGGP